MIASISRPRIRLWWPLIALALIPACRPAGENWGAEIGKPAPPYSAVTLSGEAVSVVSLRGKPILLNVWATWCGPCLDEIPYLRRLHEERSSQGLEIIGVSVDAAGEQEKVTSFAKDLNMLYPLWHDPDQRVMSVFLSIGVPASYLIDRDGVLRWKHLGVLRANNSTFSAVLDSAMKSSGTG